MDDIRALDGDALEARLAAARRELFEARAGGAPVKRPHRIKELRRDVARLCAARNERGGARGR